MKKLAKNLWQFTTKKGGMVQMSLRSNLETYYVEFQKRYIGGSKKIGHKELNTLDREEAVKEIRRYELLKEI